MTGFLPSPKTFPVGFGAFRIENGEYVFLILSYGKNYPPTNTKDIIQVIEPALQRDKSGLLRRVLEEWEPVTGKV